MAAHHPVPIQEDVRDLLGDLLGRSVAVDRTEPLDPITDGRGMVGVYVTAEGDVGALCFFDVDFAILVGAALVMVPPTAARQQLTGGALDDQHVEFAHEVANILSRLVNSPRTPHLRLDGLHRANETIPEAALALAAAPEFRRDFITQILDYGTGRVSILVA